ncbi:MAG: laccase domain-containing protein, partial [Gammaproteobacteria bacterium]|nr:laccase domain-containing protein [Gammaproteobacteria bacterium]
MIELLRPDWPAPKGVQALSTLRIGGVSQAPFDGFNLASHVGDNPEAVAQNRRLLRHHAKLPAEPQWLNQVHGREIIKAPSAPISTPPDADAIWSDAAGRVCAVLTADCLPLLYCSLDGRYIAAA